MKVGTMSDQVSNGQRTRPFCAPARAVKVEAHARWLGAAVVMW